MQPYGYRIVNGRAETDAILAKNIERLFQLYLEGFAVKYCAAETGIPYSVAGRILSNQTYLGTDFYPAIIEKAIFDRAQAERAERRKKYFRNDCPRKKQALSMHRTFQMNPVVHVGGPAAADQISWLYDNIEISGKAEPHGYRMGERRKEELKTLLYRYSDDAEI